MPAACPNRVVLRVELADTAPLIWREIAVPSNITFARLHDALQIAMGWTNSHLHHFRCGGVCIEMDQEGIAQSVNEEKKLAIHEAETRLDRFKVAPGLKIEYLYDFGDDWLHRITIRSVEPSNNVITPVCMAGDRAGPPDDSGGPGGFNDMLELREKKRKRQKLTQHEREMVEWLGKFDPEAFDVDDVNAQLRLEFAGQRRARR